MDNAFDLAARKLRPLFFMACVLALPVFFVSYYYGLKLMFEAVPRWAFIGIGVSHIIVWIAATMLHDSQKEKR